jgi:hypothetical protein
MKYSDELFLNYQDVQQLLWKETFDDYIELYLDLQLVGEVEVWTDTGNGSKEYIIINSEIVYLDSIKEVY